MDVTNHKDINQHIRVTFGAFSVSSHALIPHDQQAILIEFTVYYDSEKRASHFCTYS